MHLLAPTGSQNANVLEEGVAVLFSHKMAKRWGSSYHSADPTYIAAARCVAVFLDLCPDGIRTLREREACFAKMTVDLIQAALP